MFEQLKQRWLDGRQILKIDEVECGDGLHPQRGVHFADDKEPRVAIVHEEELKYMVFENEKDSIEKRGLALSTATYNLQKGVMDALRFFNPKYKEQNAIMANIEDSLKSLRDRFDRAVLADDNGDYDEFTFKLSRIIEVIKKHGKEVDYSAFTEKGLKVFQKVLELDLGYKEAGTLIPALGRAFNHLFQQACEAALGIPSGETRMRDMIDFVEAYEAIHGTPKELRDEIKPSISAEVKEEGTVEPPKEDGQVEEVQQ